jgi:hypothetical protein
MAAPGNQASPSDFADHHLVKAGSFTEVAEAVDSNGRVHIAAGDENDIRYITNASGSWVTRKVFVHTEGINGYLWGQPTIALDPTNHVYIAATRFPYGEGGEGIFYATNKGHTNGAFNAPLRLLDAPYGEPQLKIYNGDIYLVAVKNWCCVGDGTVVLATNKGDRPMSAQTIGRGQYPSLQMTSDGYARVAYERGDTAPGLYYATAASHRGNFTTTHIPGTNANDTSALLAVTLYAAQIFWRHDNSGSGNWRFTYSQGGGWHSFYTVPHSTSNMDGAIAPLRTGYADLALTGVNVTAHERCGSEAPGTWCNDTVASNVHATAVAAAFGPSQTIYVVWVQNGDLWYSFQQFVSP